MSTRLFAVVAVVISVVAPSAATADAPATQPSTQSATQPAVQLSGIAWQSWSDDLFAKAKAEHKFVLLDLEAVWCHWCHVQDEITYHDPKVIALINEKYIPVKVDQDSRPDISNRYEDYGWPATIVFNSDGGEIVKRSGYLPPKMMSSMLQAIIDDPKPGPSVTQAEEITFSDATSLDPSLREVLQKKILAGYDSQLGGWGKIHKFVDWDKMEYEMSLYRDGDTDAGKRAQQTLTAGLKLIDPVWGGVYQYSIDGDWDHPHFEKLMQFQGELMRIYSLAYLTFHDPAYLKAATELHRFIHTFLLNPDGGFGVSQDADLIDGKYAEDYFKLDDAHRRLAGIPRVDRHEYARENGWAIRGLTWLYSAGGTGSESAMQDAIASANFVISHRALDGGGFSHGDLDPAGPYLGDTLSMGQAFLDLYAVTADRTWLHRAEQAAGFIGEHFGGESSPGFATTAWTKNQSFPPMPEIAENVSAARFFNLLFHYTGNHRDRDLASRAMKFIATPAIATASDASAAAILLADREFSSDPLHITIVGEKSSPDGKSLYATALTAPISYRRIEWYDPSEGRLPNADVDYPVFKFPAAFLCTGNACSSPMRTPQALAEKLASGLSRPKLRVESSLCR